MKDKFRIAFFTALGFFVLAIILGMLYASSVLKARASMAAVQNASVSSLPAGMASGLWGNYPYYVAIGSTACVGGFTVIYTGTIGSLGFASGSATLDTAKGPGWLSNTKMGDQGYCMAESRTIGRNVQANGSANEQWRWLNVYPWNSTIPYETVKCAVCMKLS